MSLLRPPNPNSHSFSSPPPRLTRIRHQSPSSPKRIVGSSPKSMLHDNGARACRSADALKKVIETNQRKIVKGKSPKREEEKKKFKKIDMERKKYTESSHIVLGEKKNLPVRKKKKNLKEYLMKAPVSPNQPIHLLRKKSPSRIDNTTNLSDIKKKELLLGLIQSMDKDQVQELIEWNQLRQHKDTTNGEIKGSLIDQSHKLNRTHQTKIKRAHSPSNDLSELPPTLKQKINDIVNGRKKSEPGQILSHKGSRILMKKHSKPNIVKGLSNSKSAASEVKRVKNNKRSIKSPVPSKKKKSVLHPHQKKYLIDKKHETILTIQNLEKMRRKRLTSNNSDYSREVEKELNNVSDAKKRRFSVSSMELEESDDIKKNKNDDSPGDNGVKINNKIQVPMHVEPRDLLISNFTEDNNIQFNAKANKKKISYDGYKVSEKSDGNRKAKDDINLKLDQIESKTPSKSEVYLSEARDNNNKMRERRDEESKDHDSMVVIDRSEQESRKKMDECVQVDPSMIDDINPLQTDKHMMTDDNILRGSYNDTMNINNNIKKVEQLAKDEYVKWNEVKSMLNQIEEKIGYKAALEVKDLFGKLEMFANQSKRNLREGFLVGELGLSNQPSEVRTKRSDDIISNQFREQKNTSSSHYQTPIAGNIDGVIDMKDNKPAVV